jgi:glycosyltransferase involved in cell wall biosynthesis
VKKAKIIFVSGFKSAEEGGIPGGQVFASRTLVESPLSQYVEWRLIDSTQEALPVPPISRRAVRASSRLIRFLWLLVAQRPSCVMLFSGNGLSFCEKGAMVFAARIFGIKVVLCPRSGLLLSEYEEMITMRRLIPLVLRRATLVVCQGRKWQEFFQQITGLPKWRLPVIPNAIRVQDYATVLPLRGSSTVKVLFMGWIEENKGIFDLLQSFEICNRKLPFTRLVICGYGSEIGNVRAWVRRSGLDCSVEMRGWVTGKAKAQALSECDLLVLPSHQEGFPNVLLEAMAAGRPVLASAVGAIEELVEHGRTGLICRPRDTKDLSEKLIQLSSDLKLRMQLGKAGYELVRQKHDIAHLWKRWQQVLDL